MPIHTSSATSEPVAPPLADSRATIVDLRTGQPLAARTRGEHPSARAFSQLVGSDARFVGSDARFVGSDARSVGGDDDPLPTPVENGQGVIVSFTLDASSTPGQVLHTATRLRASGHRISLAHVGETPASVALLPLLQPDLIEVDLRALRRQPDWQSSQTYNAISAYAEELPALVLATGIDTEGDRMLAAAFGATLAEGPLFPRVGDGDDRRPEGVRFAAPPRPLIPPTTPFRVAAELCGTTPAGRVQLLNASHILETCAFDCDEATVVLSTFQKSTNLTANTTELYSALARNLSYVYAFTHPVGVSEERLREIPDLRIRTFALHDPLSQEWNVIILNARYQAMLVARERPGATGGDDEFDYVLTHDRPTILRAAQSLIPHL